MYGCHNPNLIILQSVEDYLHSVLARSEYAILICSLTCVEALTLVVFFGDEYVYVQFEYARRTIDNQDSVKKYGLIAYERCIL